MWILHQRNATSMQCLESLDNIYGFYIMVF